MLTSTVMRFVQSVPTEANAFASSEPHPLETAPVHWLVYESKS